MFFFIHKNIEIIGIPTPNRKLVYKNIFITFFVVNIARFPLLRRILNIMCIELYILLSYFISYGIACVKQFLPFWLRYLI